MKTKKRICITISPKLKAEAETWAAEKEISLSAYISDALKWQINHDKRRKSNGEEVYKDYKDEYRIKEPEKETEQTEAEQSEELDRLMKKAFPQAEPKEEEHQKTKIEQEADAIISVALARGEEDPKAFVKEFLDESPYYTKTEKEQIYEEACKYI